MAVIGLVEAVEAATTPPMAIADPGEAQAPAAANIKAGAIEQQRASGTIRAPI